MKNRPLMAKYDLRLKTEIQDFLPVIGGQTPSKLIQSFDGASLSSGIITHSGDGSPVVDMESAYHAASCLKIGLIDGDAACYEIHPAAAMNLKALSETNTEYARVLRTGKSANAEDRLFFVLNTKTTGRTGSGYCYTTIIFHSGAASATIGPINIDTGNSYSSAWNKVQADLSSASYSAGFTDDSWETIDKISVYIYCVNTSPETIQVYLQDCCVALPAYSAIHGSVPTSYYPDVHPTYDVLTCNAIFVSRLFGDDANSGATRDAPVATLEKAISLLNASTPYICVLDSCTYAPVLTLTDGGITGSIPDNTTIIADYLETPIVSAKASLLDGLNVGPRTSGRTAFYKGGGTKYAVKQDGSGPGGYTTIGAAYAAAGNGDCIEIQDNGTYDEYLLINKDLVIQAQAGKIPTWSHVSDDIICKFTASTVGVKVYGIKFKGAGASTTKAVESTYSATLKDCSFSGFNGVIVADTGHDSLVVDSCVFFDNAESIKCICFPSGQSASVKQVINCRGMMEGITTGNYFVYAAEASGAGPLELLFYNNEVLSSLSDSLGSCVYIQSGVSPNTVLYAYYNDTNMMMNNASGNGAANIYAGYNYFHDNSAAYGINSYHANVISAHNNYFKNVSRGCNTQGDTVQDIQSNIFYRCSVAGIYTTSYAGSFNDKYNIFVECERAYEHNLTSFTAMSNMVMVNCTTGVELNSSITLTLSNCVRYNSPNNAISGSITDGTGIINADPNFRNPFLDDFSWDGTSVLESNTSIYVDGLNAFINPSSKCVYFQYMRLVGPISGIMLATTGKLTQLKYCDIFGGMMGINETINYALLENCYISGNGIGARLFTETTHWFNICRGNNVGFLVRGNVSFQNCTGTENAYGAQAPDVGYFKQRNSIAATITECVFVKNSSYDYALNVDPVNCVFYSSYYDVPAAKYDAQLLDPVNLFPAIRRLGYDKDNGAYQASDIVPGNNIGARNVNHITSTLEGQQYSFLYVGSIDDLDLDDIDWNPDFIALENPQNIDHDVSAVAGQSATRLDGMYLSRPAAYPMEITLRWAAPDKQAKITGAKQALTDMFKSFWVVGLSFNMGLDWNWYKVKKDGSLHFEQNGYFHDWQPWGATRLTLRLIENFNMADYVGC